MNPIGVLVADDDRDVVEGTAHLLELLGFRAVAVADAAEIRDVVRRERPRVLIQDARMPGLDLDRLLVELAADESIQPLAIVVWTALADGDGRWRELGAARVIEKPVSPRVLKALIEELAASD